MTADDYADLARHAEAIPPEARHWYVSGLDEVYVGDGSGSDPCVAQVDGGRRMARFIAAANPATILRLIAEVRDLSEQLAQAYRDEVLAHDERDALAARLAAVEALADDLARFDCVEDEVPRGIDVPDDYEAGLHDAARRLRAALSAAPTDTTKETP